MDNKITKKRLSDFIAYEWFAVILAIVLFIAGWEVVYALIEVKPTPGQGFKYFYDVGVDSSETSRLYNLTKGSVSYDVLSFSVETVSPEHDLIAERLAVVDGDVAFTSTVKKEGDLTTNNLVRAHLLIDSYKTYSLDDLLFDAQKYLQENFFKDEYKNQTLTSQEYTADKIDKNKVRQVFLERMDGDNRYRTSSKKEEGIAHEQQRIEQLCKEVCDFARFMEYAKTQKPELLYTYTKHTQSLALARLTGTPTDIKEVEELYNLYNERKPNAPYAINLSALEGGTSPSEYFKLDGKDNAQGVVMMVFDFHSEQPHLQYEAISFMNAIIRECSNILD